LNSLMLFLLRLFLLLAAASAQLDPKAPSPAVRRVSFLSASPASPATVPALRPCFERYPNHRLVSLKPYHSEWRMRTEEHCLQFCSDTRSRCRSVVYDSGQHICHFFLDDGYDFTITAAKMIYLRVSSRECLDRISSSSSGANSVDWGSREVVTAPATPTLPPAHFTIPSAPTFSQDEQMEVAEASNEETMTATTDAASDTTTYSASTEELGTELPSATDEQDGIDLEEIGGQNEVLRDVNGIENMEKRWQSSMEQLVKNTEDYAFKGARIRTALPFRVPSDFWSEGGNGNRHCSTLFSIEHNQLIN
uniref:Apple domain-containing protein n=1 Tax=Heligmosomoides polygyrus TaxID=6339 RepID=A0A8L8KFD0_HELPZ